MDEIDIEIIGDEDLTRFHEIIERAKSNVSISPSGLSLTSHAGIENLNDFVASQSNCFRALSEKASSFPNIPILPLIDAIHSVTALANDDPRILNHEISLPPNAQTRFNSLMENYFKEHPLQIDTNAKESIILSCTVLNTLYATADHSALVLASFSESVSFLLNLLRSIL